MSFSIRTRTDAKRWESIAPIYIKSIKSQEFSYMSSLLNKLLFTKIIEAIPEVKNKKILDAGCGEGRLSRLLNRMGARVEGCDVSKTMIEEAVKIEKEKKMGIKYFQHDLTEKFTAAHKYDVIVSNLVLFNIYDFQKSIGNLSQILKNRGEFIFSILHPCFNITKSQWLGLKSLGPKGGEFTFRINKSYVFPTFYSKKYSYLFGKGLVNFYHRPLQSYSKTLSDHSFFIKNIIEPVLDIKDVPSDDNYLHHYLPRFMIITAIKDGLSPH